MSLGRSLSVLLLIAGLSACGDDEPDPLPSNGSSSASPPASTAATDPTAAALAQYTAFWRVTGSAINGVPTAQLRQRMSAVAADPLLSRLVTNIEGARARGVVAYGETKPRPTVSDATGTAIDIRDCQDNSGTGNLDQKTNRKLTVGVARVVATARLTEQDGTWKVTELTFPGGTC